jgi:hypothetical protein
MQDIDLANCIHKEILEELLEANERYIAQHGDKETPPIPGWPDSVRLVKSLSPFEETSTGRLEFNELEA